MSNVGVVFASTGGNKMIRTLRSFQRMEPNLPVHIVFDTSSHTWRTGDGGNRPGFGERPGLKTRFVENYAHINGILNSGMRWMKELGFEHAALFHDDLVFSPLSKHRHSLSNWFPSDSFKYPPSSGIRFSHFETFVPDEDSRRSSEKWDLEDLESEELWKFLVDYTVRDGADCRPPGRSFWFKYEGPDKIRKWNRLGPSGQIVPIETWDRVGQFDETQGIFYDGEYPSECFLRKLPPVWAVTNFPYIHLHNQSMNPWGDPAPGPFGDTMKAYAARFKGTHGKPEPWADFWGDNWEEEWGYDTDLYRLQSANT